MALVTWRPRGSLFDVRDEVNRLLAETIDGEEVSFGEAFKDHVKTFSLDDYDVCPACRE